MPRDAYVQVLFAYAVNLRRNAEKSNLRECTKGFMARHLEIDPNCAPRRKLNDPYRNNEETRLS